MVMWSLGLTQVLLVIKHIILLQGPGAFRHKKQIGMPFTNIKRLKCQALIPGSSLNLFVDLYVVFFEKAF